MSDFILPALQQSFHYRGISGVRFELEGLSKARDPFVLYIIILPCWNMMPVPMWLRWSNWN